MEIEIKENELGGKVWSYFLKIRRDNGHSWGIEITDTNEMRQVAAALLNKAGEIEYNQWLEQYWETIYMSCTDNTNCPSCGNTLEINQKYIRENYILLDISSLPASYYIYWCRNCDQAYNGLGELV